MIDVATRPQPRFAASAPEASRPSARPVAVAAWAVLAVAMVLAESVARLGARGAATIAAGLDGPHWFALGALTLLFGYVEGWRGLHRRFVPSTIARAFAAARSPDPLARWLAPLHALGLLGGDRRARARAWRGAALIAAAVALVRLLPAPWRGLVDAAIAASLAWGLVSLLVAFDRVRRAPSF
jgi:hypothetical protein